MRAKHEICYDSDYVHRNPLSQWCTSLRQHGWFSCFITSYLRFNCCVFTHWTRYTVNTQLHSYTFWTLLMIATLIITISKWQHCKFDNWRWLSAHCDTLISCTLEIFLLTYLLTYFSFSDFCVEFTVKFVDPVNSHTSHTRTRYMLWVTVWLASSLRHCDEFTARRLYCFPSGLSC